MKILLIILLSTSVYAETLCLKKKIKIPVVNSKVTVKITNKFIKTATTCPTGYEPVFEPDSGTLAPGATLTGVYNATGISTQDYAADSISFQKPLSSAPTVEIVRLSSSGTNCTGTFENPTAPSGYLCIYESYSGNLVPGSNGILVYDLAGSLINVASKQGAALYIYKNNSSNFYGWGSWAVTGN